jgi:DNA-binding MarR family transcriptional regulator
VKHDRGPLVAESHGPAVRQPEVSPERPQKDDPLDEIAWYIGRAYYAYVGLLEQILAETGLDRHLRPGMGHILFVLFEQDGRSIKEIAARTQLSGSTLTGMLARMEKAGVIGRRRDDEDGRVIRVRLTPLGRSLEPRCRLVIGTLGEVFHAGMGAKDALHAKRLLRRLTETMRTEDQRRRRSAGD